MNFSNLPRSREISNKNLWSFLYHFITLCLILLNTKSMRLVKERVVYTMAKDMAKCGESLLEHLAGMLVI